MLKVLRSQKSDTTISRHQELIGVTPATICREMKGLGDLDHPISSEGKGVLCLQISIDLPTSSKSCCHSLQLSYHPRNRELFNEQ